MSHPIWKGVKNACLHKQPLKKRNCGDQITGPEKYFTLVCYHCCHGYWHLKWPARVNLHKLVNKEGVLFAWTLVLLKKKCELNVEMLKSSRYHFCYFKFRWIWLAFAFILLIFIFIIFNVQPKKCTFKKSLNIGITYGTFFFQIWCSFIFYSQIVVFLGGFPPHFPTNENETDFHLTYSSLLFLELLSRIISWRSNWSYRMSLQLSCCPGGFCGTLKLKVEASCVGVDSGCHTISEETGFPCSHFRSSNYGCSLGPLVFLMN